MKTRWLRKYPKVPGAERFNAYYVLVELIRAEEKVTEHAVYEFRDDPERTAAVGFPCQKRVRVGTREDREAGFVIREKGRKPRWVPARDVFERDPHGYDASVVATCRSRKM